VVDFGLQASGFVIKDLDTILTEIEDDQRAAFGADFDVSPSSPEGIANGIIAAKLAEAWQQLGAVYNSEYPNGAEDTSLDQLCQLTGVRRLPATRSAVTAGITGTPGTVLTDGFDNTRIKNSGTNSLWYLAMGAAAGSQVVIPAASSTTAAFEARDFGPVAGLAGSLSVIDTPISGWTAVSNALDASLGANVETDAALRLRRSRLLRSQGDGTVDSIRAHLLEVDDVTAAYVFENVTLITDSNGVPGKAIECVVLGGTTDDIAQAIWDHKDAGISAYGGATGNAVDSLGATRVMAFTRPTELTVYASLTALTGAGWGGATADIATALTAYGSVLGIGASESKKPGYIVYRDADRPVFDVSGVEDVTDFRIGLSAAPTGAVNVAVGTRQISSWDTSRIVVTLL
jgi:uncharacterized phage protein gp47/JayE